MCVLVVMCVYVCVLVFKFVYVLWSSHVSISVCSQMADCVSKVELTVSCTTLLDKDVGSKSDPLCVLLQSTGDNQWEEVCVCVCVCGCVCVRLGYLDYHYIYVYIFTNGTYL